MRKTLAAIFALVALSMPSAPVWAAPITMVKTASTKSDPTNTLTAPRAIPGAIVEYKIALTGATSSASGIEFTDQVPPNTSFCLAGFDLSGAPVVFTDTSFLLSSGVGFPFTSIRNTTDNLDFSNNNGVTWSYQPTADADNCDSQITNIRVRFSGSLGAGKTVQLQFRVRVR